MVLSGLTIVLWEVEMKYFTMGWFHNGNTKHYSLERWTKGYLMIWGVFLLFSGNEGPPKGPLGSPMVLNGQTSVSWEVEIKYSTIYWFQNGNAWTKEYLIWGIFMRFSGTDGPPEGPWESGIILNGQTSVPWEVEIKNSTMGWVDCGNTERYLLERLTKEYLMIWGV